MTNVYLKWSENESFCTQRTLNAIYNFHFISLYWTSNVCAHIRKWCTYFAWTFMRAFTGCNDPMLLYRAGLFENVLPDWNGPLYDLKQYNCTFCFYNSSCHSVRFSDIISVGVRENLYITYGTFLIWRRNTYAYINACDFKNYTFINSFRIVSDYWCQRVEYAIIFLWFL